MVGLERGKRYMHGVTYTLNIIMSPDDCVGDILPRHKHSGDENIRKHLIKSVEISKKRCSSSITCVDCV